MKGREEFGLSNQPHCEIALLCPQDREIHHVDDLIECYFEYVPLTGHRSDTVVFEHQFL